MAPKSLSSCFLPVRLVLLLVKKTGVSHALARLQHVVLLPGPPTPPSPALRPRPSRRIPNGGGEGFVVQEERGEVEFVVLLDH